MKYDLTDWKTSSSLSVSLGTEWVDMVSSSHNKHFSKWASSDDKLGHIECPTVFSSPSLWWCCPTKTLLSNCIEAGNKKKKKNVFGNVAGQQCFKHLSHSWTCTASSCCYKDFQRIHPKSLCCHFNLSLTYGIVCLNACGYCTYYFTRVCPSTCRTSPIN